jgi:hypothetical protein
MNRGSQSRVFIHNCVINFICHHFKHSMWALFLYMGSVYVNPKKICFDTQLGDDNETAAGGAAQPSPGDQGVGTSYKSAKSEKSGAGSYCLGCTDDKGSSVRVLVCQCRSHSLLMYTQSTCRPRYNDFMGWVVRASHFKIWFCRSEPFLSFVSSLWRTQCLLHSHGYSKSTH